MSPTGPPATTPSPAVDAAFVLVDELRRCGVRDICLSPGGRSTPLAIAVHAQPELQTHIITDERASAFFALGLAKATRKPVALICTSGTAAANFAPAVVEAALSGVPLILVTADRPPELRDCGAPQTIRQDDLYRHHVKWFAELATPGPDEPPLAYFRSVACRAVGQALATPTGPVHLNAPYREPLSGVVDRDRLETGRDFDAPWTTVEPSHEALTPTQAEFFVRAVHGRRGLVVCGPRTTETDATAIVELAESLGWPIVAEPLSGVRFCGTRSAALIDACDIVLRSTVFCDNTRPEVVLRFGATPTSKPLNRYLAATKGTQYVITRERWGDPDFNASHVLAADPGTFASTVLTQLPGEPKPDTNWLASWRSASDRARNRIATLLDAPGPVCEAAIARTIIAALPNDAALLVGNSMPIRDIDTYGEARRDGPSRRLWMHGNRGANGIDGLIATSLGIAARHSGPTYAWIGDLSALHDIGALQIAARYRLDLCLIVVNNDGGGIFSYLPQAKLGDVFEPFFGTPHGLDFQQAAGMCGAEYVRTDSLAALRAALTPASGLRIIEIRTDRAYNVERSRAVVAEALAAVDDGFRTVP